MMKGKLIYYPDGCFYSHCSHKYVNCADALTNATLYASPYMVATVKGYTKHYYAESERIASRIGNGGLACIDSPLVALPTCTSKLNTNSAYFDTVAQNRLSAPNYITAHLLDTLYHWKIPHGYTEPDCYWYHPDHLGSSSWITYTDGSAVQHLHYLPWGEDFVDQRSTSWNAMYTFSAKEKDTETGLSYFGSRYYSSDLSIWLSVDPMSDKYPSLSPYVYCANNPIKLVDLNGEEVYLEGDDVAAALQQLQNQTSLKLSIDQNGKLNYEGVAENKIDELLINAITNEDITVNMLCSTKDRIGGINLVNGGAFMGNTYEDGKVCTDQYVCPSALAQFDKSVKDKIPGLTMVHELAESFYGGEIALERKQGSPYGETPGSTYDEAHWCANQIVIGNRGPVYKINPFKANPNYNPNLPLSPFNVPYLQGEFKVQDGWRRVTDKNGM